MRQKIKNKVFSEEKCLLLAHIGVLSGKDEDFELLIEQSRNMDDQREIYDLVELLADAGKMTLAREIACELRNSNLIFRAYQYISLKSGDSQDFRSAITAIETNNQADEIDKRSMMSKVMESLAKTRKYRWARSLALGSKYWDVELENIAKIAFDAKDHLEAFNLAMETGNAKIASAAISGTLEEGAIEKAKAMADKLTGIYSADYFRAYAHLDIAEKTNDQEDYCKAYEAAMASCKNDSKVYSSNLMMDLALTYLDKRFAGLAIDEALQEAYRETCIEEIVKNLEKFREAMKKRIDKKDG